jgi:acyl carrier protein phosphodiesterase
MNFLLHLRLSELAGLPPAGAIIGDVLRGRIDPTLPRPLALSIALHRRVDALSDRHPQLLQLKAGFPPAARRYAGIVLDLLCDHVAANDWRHYGRPDESLDAFSQRMARAVADDSAWRLSVDQAAPGIARFSKLLLGYRETAGIDRAILRIAERLRDPQPFIDAANSWQARIPATSAALPQIFEDLQRAARGFVDAG